MTIPDDLTSTRTHAHRLVEAEFLVGNKDSILSALEGRDREIEALRARVGWEVAERNREAGARNVATAVDLNVIEARLNAATPGPWIGMSSADGGGSFEGEIRSADFAHIATMTDTNPDADERLIAHAPEDLRALLAEVRRLTDALATARLDGARAMREVAAELLDEEPSVPNRVTAEIRAIDPAAVVGSGS